MKIALIQQHSVSDHADNLARGVQAFKSAAENGAELVAYAELGLTYFYPQKPAAADDLKKAEPVPGPMTDVFTRLSREHGIVTVLNLFERDGDNTYDASPVIDADGTILGVTRMAHVMNGLGFYEKGYYNLGNNQRFVYDTSVGRIGIAICYDRHFPEYMRNLALEGAQLVIIPQAGAVGEWPDGLFEAELRVAAFQNGYFAALVNRVGREDHLHFAGDSFVVNPEGRILAQAPSGKDAILYADLDIKQSLECTARRFFIPDRRPALYRSFFNSGENG
jgi:beta-ureidopropionase